MRLARAEEGGRPVFTVYDSDHVEMIIYISEAGENVHIAYPKTRLVKGGECRWLKAEWFLEIAEAVKEQRAKYEEGKKPPASLR